MGSLPGRSPDRRVLAVPKGWLARLVACQPCLWLAFFPPSPRPRSQSALPLRGRGSLKVYFAGGFAPGTPALNRLRHLQTLPCRCPMGGLSGRSPGRRVLAVPKGWFARLVACQPCLWLYFFPPSPCPPSPPGKGGIKVIFMQGASPLASPRAEPMVRRITERKRFPASGAARVQPPGTCMARLVSAASGLMPGCRGRSPRRNKLWISPFPGGEGGWGDGGKKAN